MKIRYVLGDLLKSNEDVIIHGCNSLGIMGSGVALGIKKTHPKAYEAYRDSFEINGSLEMGDVIWAECNGVLVGNAITQEKYGRDPKIVYCDYDAIRAAMQDVESKVSGVYETVGLPMIGAGLGNGDWSIISAIIEEEAKSFTPVVYILDQQIFNGLTKV